MEAAPLLPRTRSRFVTVLGWFCAIAGGLSVPVRLVEVVGILATPSDLEELASASEHPAVAFGLQHAVLISVALLLAAILILIVGIGLIRRRSWALPTGAVLLLLGGIRTSAALYLTLSGSIPIPPGVDPESVPSAAPFLGSLYVASLAWLAFVLWKFRQPAVLAEFRGRRTTSAL